jgi:Holliday junction resolvase
MNNRARGIRGELEFRNFLREHGFEARRGQQFAGGGDSPDVVHDVPKCHFEVKRTNALRIREALEQAHRDAAPGDTPVVAWRRDADPGKKAPPWVAILDMDDYLLLVRELNVLKGLL